MRDIHTPYITDPEEIAILEQSMHGEMQYTLMNDFLAKYTLQNDLYALAGLLSALLNLDLNEITDINILNPVELNEAIDDKKCILDVKLELNHSTIINIEIQSVYQSFWPERSLTYLCRMFDHLKEGQGYSDLKPCIQIGILENDIFKSDDSRYTGDFYSEYQILHMKKHTGYCGKFKICVLSLNHLDEVPENERKNHNGLYYWAKLFTVKSWEELKMIASEDSRMASYVTTVRKLSAEEKVAQACEARRRYSNDIATYEEEKRLAKQEAQEAKQEAEEAKRREEKAEQKAEEAKQEAEEAKQKAQEAEREAQEARLKMEEMARELELLRGKVK